MAAVVEAENKHEEAIAKGGELLFCGATCWDTIGRKKGAPEHNLVSPTRLRPLVGVDIRFVASGCSSCHCVAIDVAGRCYTWGRNDKGQLGHGDKVTRDVPTPVSGLAKYKIVKAGAGRSHSVVVTDEGESLAFGWNKHGQLGIGSIKNEIEPSPVRCLVSEVKDVSCGADFTVWLSSAEGASILTAGCPQYGQLGHGTDNEYNAKDSSVKLVYEPQPHPKAIASLSKETIVKLACGNNHTVAVDSNGYVYTWGFGGYGRLGHRQQKDEWTPRPVEVFQRQNVLPPDAVVSAGSANSSCTAGGGQLYMWGKTKHTGDNWMYPKPLMDLSGWNICCMDSGNMHHFVGADASCISWGLAQHGELGYGPNGPKSSAVPKKVDSLEGMHVIGVASGFGHSTIIIDRSNVGDRLDQLDVYEGKSSGEAIEEPKSKDPDVKRTTKRSVGKASGNSTKRKKSEELSDSEDEASDDSGNSEELMNGQSKKRLMAGKASGGGLGKGAKKSASEGNGSGRGRGRPLANESSQSSQGNAKMRGRPRKL